MDEKKKEPQESIPASNPRKSNASAWIAIVVVAVIIGAAVLFRGEKKSAQPEIKSPVSNSSESSIEIPSTNDTAVKTFDISAKPFEFSMKEIRVKKGNKIRINLTSTAGMHDWVIDEFSARTKIIQAEQSDSVEFIADKSGTFEYYCSVPTHRQQGMVGKLIVE